MTVNANSTRELNIDRLVRRSYQLAGLLDNQQSPDADAVAKAMDFLEIDLDALQAEANMSWDTELYEVPIVAGTLEYDLPADTFDVIDDGMFKAAGDSSETRVSAILRNDYLLKSTKNTQSRPVNFYPERTSGFRLKLWPVPDSAGTLTIQRRRMLADNNDGTKTVDLERVWGKYLAWQLAEYLCFSAAQENNRASYCNKRAGEAKTTAKMFARQRPSTHIKLMHRGPQQ